ncbi:unnamed protein product [Allacma fusca]|uniref:Uncharacterized protein n=1 Tax=Allacma fusca TaxID=39272 RepID=A0A8J2KA12_9HEXA|nr:unnamed protein product [Allacma fusca]
MESPGKARIFRPAKGEDFDHSFERKIDYSPYPFDRAPLGESKVLPEPTARLASSKDSVSRARKQRREISRKLSNKENSPPRNSPKRQIVGGSIIYYNSNRSGIRSPRNIQDSTISPKKLPFAETASLINSQLGILAAGPPFKPMVPGRGAEGDRDETIQSFSTVSRKDSVGRPEESSRKKLTEIYSLVTVRHSQGQTSEKLSKRTLRNPQIFPQLETHQIMSRPTATAVASRE